MDYSQTVNLPVTDFPMKADLPKREPAMLATWAKEKIYEEGLKRRSPLKGQKQFILHDGPPYANGHLHLGHALNKILKDIIVRFKTMAGFYAPYVPGWDCHGLPIELQLMKELKVTDKNKVDRADFRRQAQTFAEKFVNIQRDEFKRMGILGDWENPYLTMADDYKKTIVSCFEALEKKGCVYRGKKPVYWCTTDETALAEAEVEYENDPGPSIYVAFPLHAPPNFNEDAGGHGDDKKAELWTSGSVSFVIWTTTPWTLPANRAIAMHPNELYVLFEDEKNKWKYIVGAKRLADFQKVCGLSGRVLDQSLGDTFKEAYARHPWIEALYVPVLMAGFVAMDKGSGLVHIAPGHGMEDYVLGSAHDLEVYSPVDDRGRFTDDVPQWAGLHVFKANALITAFLQEKGLLLHSEEISHSYPHCWRCHRPVIFRATEQWFLSIDHEELRARALNALQGVKFYPDFGRNRITGMVESRPDWCLSRQRLWGTEIPSSGHFPSPPSPDIFDVWFESGVSWAAVLKKRPELSYPADMYLEGSDQHRGWFQVSLIPSVALENQAPFRALLTHGFVMDGNGRPMSKSLGNVISPEEIIKQYGADVLRLWVGSSDYGNDVRLSPEIIKGLVDNYRKIRNTFKYLLGNLAGFDTGIDTVAFEHLTEIDRWALFKLRELTERVMCCYEKYEFHRASAHLVDFCGSTLSGFYLDILKDRLYCDPPRSLSRRSAQTVLRYLADYLTRLWAPILAFTADEAWRSLGHAQAVSLEDLPSVEAQWQNQPIQELLTLREGILLALEKARQGGRIKGNLEAKVTCFSSTPATKGILERYEAQLPTLCIVSQVVISSDPLTEPDGEKDGVQIKVEKASGQKCARCWIYKTDLGVQGAYPDICGRCTNAVEEWKKAHEN